MVQGWTADEAMQIPGWPGGAGTNYVDYPFVQRFRRVDPFANTGTTLGVGAGVQPSMASVAGSLGYLSLRPAESVIGCEFSARRDGGAGPAESMIAWLDNRDDLYDQTDITYKWTFALEGTGGFAPPAPGNDIGQFKVTTTLPSLGVNDRIIRAGGDGSSQIGATFDKPGTGKVRLIKPGSGEAGGDNAQVATGWRGWLVGFRVQGDFVATTTGATYDTGRHTNVDGYWLWVRPLTPASWAPDADLRVSLYHTEASSTGATGVTRRLLAQHDIPNGTANLDLQSPVNVEIEVDNVSSNVEIKAFLSPYDGFRTQMFASTLPGTVTAPLSGSSVTIASDGTVTDANATYKLTTNGTIAFGGHPDRIETFGSTGISDLSLVEGLVAFEAVRTSTSSVLVRDEFQRVGILFGEPFVNSGVQVVRNRFGKDGPSLESDWYWCMNANSDHGTNKVDRRLIPADTGATVYDPNDYWLVDVEEAAPPAVAGFDVNRMEIVSLRPADDPRSQHRRITFRPGAGNTANGNYDGQVQYFGIGLFGSAIIGYAQAGIVARLTVITDSTGAQTSVLVEIANYVATGIGGDPFLGPIVRQTLSSPPDLFDGSDHTLSFDCRTFSSDGSGNTPLVYSVELDGSPVVWVEADVQRGKEVQLLASGEVTDFGPPLTEGNVEFLIFNSDTAETDVLGVKLWDPWRIHTWEQLTLTNGGGLAPDEMASVAIADEGTPTGELDDVLCVDFAIQETYHVHSQTHEFESGHTQGVLINDDPRPVFECRGTITRSERDALVTFWDDHLGHEIPFYWTEDGEAQRICAFVEDTLRTSLVGPDIYLVTFQLEVLTNA